MTKRQQIKQFVKEFVAEEKRLAEYKLRKLSNHVGWSTAQALYPDAPWYTKVAQVIKNYRRKPILEAERQAVDAWVAHKQSCEIDGISTDVQSYFPGRGAEVVKHYDPAGKEIPYPKREANS